MKLKRYVNDPLDAKLSDKQLRLLKWGDPTGLMSAAEIERVGDGDVILGGMILTAQFLGLPEPRWDGEYVETTREQDVEFHHSRLKSFVADLPHFRFDRRASLMLTALRLRDLFPRAWRDYVDRYDISIDDQRDIYGVE